MNLRHLTLCAALCAASVLLHGCPDVVAVEVNNLGTSVGGGWTGTIAETSILSWDLNEVPEGVGLHVTGTGQIQSAACLTAITIDGTRIDDETFLSVTIDGMPDFVMTVVGGVVDEYFEGVYSIEGGTAPPSCIPAVGGLLRVATRTPDGVTGVFEGPWLPATTFSGSGAWATAHLTQAGDEIYGVVTWDNYTCSSGGFFFGELNGTELLANVRSLELGESFYFLDGVWDAEARTISGPSTMLGPGPGPECWLNTEEYVQLAEVGVEAATDDGAGVAVGVEPAGVLIEQPVTGPARIAGELFRPLLESR